MPANAMAADQNRRIVYVVDDAGKVSARQVRPGPRLHGYRVVREGLQGDETIVINGLMSVRPGVVVTPNLVELPPTAAAQGKGTRDSSCALPLSSSRRPFLRRPLPWCWSSSACMFG